MNIGTSLKTISKNQLCSFVGTGGYVELAETDVLSDGSIVTAAAMMPLLNSGNDKGEGILPPGYQKVEFLESSGTQFIDTGIVTDGTYTIAATLRGNNVGGSNDIWGRRGSDGASFAQRFSRTYWLIAFYYVWGGQLSENQLNSAQIHDYIVTEGQKRIIVDGKSFNLNALNMSEVNASNPSSKTHYLFAANGGNRGQVCFYSFRMADGEGKEVLDFVPVLNAEGTPCMFDKASKKCFYNIGTGHFRVGIATLQQAREFQLPDNTGNAMRVLLVSLPHEARTDFITQNHLDYLTSLNWSINVQYRDGDIPADYTKVDFLESTGTQYLRLPNLNVTNEDTINCDFSASAYSNSAANGIFSTYNYDSEEKVREYLLTHYGPFQVAFEWKSKSIGNTDISFNEKYSTALSGSGVKINGILVVTPQAATFSYTDFVLFTQRVLGKFWNSLIKLFSFSVPGKCRLIPALRNSDGVPGMWDTVSKQFFENSGTGAFIVGIKTLNDARMLDKALPAVPAGSTYSITLSLPVEASTDAPAQKALKDLAARGWSVNIQYREEEIPAGYAKVAFLESSGTQYIDTGVVTDGTYTISTKFVVNDTFGNVPIWGRTGNANNGESQAVCASTSQHLIAFQYVWRGGLYQWRVDLSQPHEYIVTEGQRSVVVDGNTVKLQGLNTSAVNASNLNSKSHYLFASNGWHNNSCVNFYSFRMQNGAGNVVLDFIPVINTSGIPGMYDKVSKQFFENKGTGQFRVGLASKEAVRNLYLEPDVPVGTTINLSVPAGTTTKDTRILKENNPNYTFNIQYRS